MIRLLAYVSIFVFFLVFLISCTGPRYKKYEADTKIKPRAVRAVKAKSGEEVTLGAPLSGVVRAAGQVMTGFKVSGTVEQVFVEEGNMVKKGDVLAVLDQRLYVAQRDQAAGALSQAKANLKMLREGSRPQEIASARASVTAAEATVDKVLADYERAKKLYEEGIISKQDMDSANAGLIQAEQALEAAEEQLKLVLEGPREEQIEAAEAAVETARGQLNITRVQLDYTSLKAPGSGTITRRVIEVGQDISAGMPVIEIANLDDLEVDSEIPEGELHKINIGDEVNVKFPAAPELSAQAEIKSIAPNADSETRGFPITVKLIDTPNGVLPGMVAMVEFDFTRPPGGVAIPLRAIVENYVFIVEDNVARKVAIEKLLSKGETVFVKGIQQGSYVIINGQNYVSDGEDVVIVDVLGIEERTRIDSNG